MHPKRIAFPFVLLLSLFSIIMSCGLARADQYPSRTIHIIVPWKAGGGTDSIARGLAASIRKVVKVPVVVTDVSGASGAVGTLDFLKRKADGYTLYFNGDADFCAMLFFNKNLPVSLDDFDYVGGVYSTPVWVLSNAKRGYHTLDDLIKAGKSHSITIGTAGLNGMHAVVADDIRGAKQIHARIIPYAGGATLKVALLGNKVDAGVIWSPVLLSAIKADKMSLLAAGGSLSRISYSAVRDTKTLKDYGIPLHASITRGLYLRKGTPAATVEKIRAIIKEAVQDKAFEKFGIKFGFRPDWMDGEKFKKENFEYYSDIKSIIAKHPLHS